MLASLLVGCGGEDRSDASRAYRPSTTAPSSDRAASDTAAAADTASVPTLADPQPVPDLSLTTLDSGPIQFDDVQGVLLVNFWATWCAPCIQEIPELNQLQSSFGERGLTVIGVALDAEGAEVVRPFAEKHGINYRVALAPERSAEEAFGGVYGLPTTFVVSAEGQITHRVTGRVTVEQMRPLLDRILPAPAPS